MQGLIHIYTGEGKGKTTAAIGLGVRACGRGLKVLMVQFLKGTPTGETESLKKLGPEFTLKRGTEVKKFTWDMDENELLETKQDQQALFAFVKEEVASGSLDLLILDEIVAAVTCGMVDLEQVLELVKNKPAGLEMVMTGRNAPVELVKLADYVSEIKAVKHPMDKGIPPRKGIEF